MLFSKKKNKTKWDYKDYDFDSYFNNYAELISSIGGGVRKSDYVLIQSPVEGKELALLVQEKCYNIGAKYVKVNIYDTEFENRLSNNMPKRAFNFINENQVKGLDQNITLEEDGVVINIITQNPGCISIDQEKDILKRKRSKMMLKDFRDAVSSDGIRWTIAAVPSKEWANQIYPKDKNSLKLLWDDIFTCTRVKNPDFIKEWKNLIRKNQKIADRLNELKVKSLYYISKKSGTDFMIDLPKSAYFKSAESKSNDKRFVANLPTEEIFSVPDKRSANGILYASKPLIVDDVLIKDFWFRFSEGKVIEYDAKIGKEKLDELLAINGADRLGEVALVPFDSPINNMNKIFYTTLFDENASCHFALGNSYNLITNDSDRKYLNNSDIHIDFMVGTEDLSIIGYLQDGTSIPIFFNGNFVKF